MITEIICASGLMFSVGSLKNLTSFRFEANPAAKTMEASWVFENAGVLKTISPIQAQLNQELSSQNVTIWTGEDQGGWSISLEHGPRTMLRYGPAFFMLKDCQISTSSGEETPAPQPHPGP